jgi:hypothetical protein
MRECEGEESARKEREREKNKLAVVEKEVSTYLFAVSQHVVRFGVRGCYGWRRKITGMMAKAFKNTIQY